MTNSLVNMVIESVNSHLTDVLQDHVELDDPTRAGLVRGGLLQDDPTIPKVSILTFPNDSDQEDKWLNEIVVRNGNSADYNPPPYEIGGGEMWYYRFTTALEMFFLPKVNRDNSRVYSSIVLSRAKRAIAQAPIGLLGTDDFGETPIQMYTVASRLTQGGGEGEFIWHAKIWWQVLVGVDL